VLAQRARNFNPDSPPVLLVLGSIARAEGKPEQPVDLFHRAAELEPNSPVALIRTALAFQQMGRDEDAIGLLRKAVYLSPDYYSPYWNLGFVYFHMGHYSEAVEAFRSVTRLAPELPDGYLRRGAALLAAGDDAEAERALRRSLRIQKTRAALNNLGVLLRYQGRDAEAVQTLQEALQVGADDSGLRLNLANALRRLGRAGEAQENFRRARDIARATLLRDPRDAVSRARLAYSMVQLGAPAFAADEALQAARIAGSDYSVIFWSVATLESVGRRHDALSLLANASREQLRDLHRQPDLAGLAKDTRFLALLERAQSPTSQEKRKKDARDY
jgi:tetratricopeptide (TPR) repeat protein